MIIRDINFSAKKIKKNKEKKRKKVKRKKPQHHRSHADVILDLITI
jgi:hypothetical protein